MFLRFHQCYLTQKTELQAFQHSHHRGARGEEKEQEIRNLFEKIIKENFLSLVKEIDIQVQETQTVPNKMNPKRPTSRYIIIKMPKVKDEAKLLKAAREKQLVTYRGVPMRLSADFLKKNFAGKKGLAISIQSDKKQRPTAQIALSSKAII